MSENVFKSIVIDINVNKGTSGSPILNENGKIIGIINWFMDKECSGGVKSEYIKQFVNNTRNENICNSYIGCLSRPLKIQDIMYNNITMASHFVRGELVLNDNEMFNKNDIILKINGVNIGILHDSIEAILYFMTPGDMIDVTYYECTPENGISWNMSQKIKQVSLIEYPDEMKESIRGKSKIKLN